MYMHVTILQTTYPSHLRIIGFSIISHLQLWGGGGGGGGGGGEGVASSVLLQ